MGCGDDHGGALVEGCEWLRTSGSYYTKAPGKGNTGEEQGDKDLSGAAKPGMVNVYDNCYLPPLSAARGKIDD
jgi:hypothetical protein